MLVELSDVHEESLLLLSRYHFLGLRAAIAFSIT